MVDDWDDDDSVEINLRDPSEVAARLLALVTIARRGFLEQRPDLITDDTPEAERFDMQSWLAEEKLLEFLWTEELLLIDTPVGRLAPEDTIAATWTIEDAVVLAWALDLIPDIPPYDRATDAATVIDALPAPWSRTTEFRNAASLRDEETIARGREQAELWADRADSYWWQLAASDELDQAGAGAEDIVGTDLQAMLTETAAEAFAAGLISRPMKDDFPTRLGAYGELLPETVEELEVIAVRRAGALDWLCGLTDE